jgi:hypothetical protein
VGGDPRGGEAARLIYTINVQENVQIPAELEIHAFEIFDRTLFYFLLLTFYF